MEGNHIFTTYKVDKLQGLKIRKRGVKTLTCLRRKKSSVSEVPFKIPVLSVMHTVVGYGSREVEMRPFHLITVWPCTLLES